MTPSFHDQQNDLNDDDPGAPDRETQVEAAELKELGDAAVALRKRIKSPELYPHPFPKEVALLLTAHLVENIGRAGPTPTVDQWRSVVDAAVDIARHVRRNSPAS